MHVVNKKRMHVVMYHGIKERKRQYSYMNEVKFPGPENATLLRPVGNIWPKLGRNDQKSESLHAFFTCTSKPNLSRLHFFFSFPIFPDFWSPWHFSPTLSPTTTRLIGERVEIHSQCLPQDRPHLCVNIWLFHN